MDDDESILKAIKRLLCVSGFRAEIFNSGRAFLDALDNHIPDCVLIDLLMPGLTGLDVQTAMATAGFSIPIIFITADGDPVVQERGAENGNAMLLHKPFTERELLEAIDTAVMQKPKQDGTLR